MSREPEVFMWSALLHDLGKATTTRVRNGRITSYDHDRDSEVLSSRFLNQFHCEAGFVQKVAKMCRWHMQILFVVRGLPFADIESMASEVPIDEIALLGLCDRLGRGGMTAERIEEEEGHIREFLSKCREALKTKV